MLLALVTTVLMAASPAPERPLTMRQAERIIDMALMAETAGDFKGARTAVEGFLKAAESPEEAAGASRLRAWLVSMRARQEALKISGRTAEGYWQAFSTLQKFGAQRAELYWGLAVKDVPEAHKRLAERGLSFRFERTLGVASVPAAQKRLSQRLRRAGVTTVKRNAHFELRVTLDTTEAKRLLAHHQVTAEGSFVLRNKDGSRRLVGSYAKRRAVQRRDEASARRFALHRLLDDLGRVAVFQLRQETLRSLAKGQSSDAPED